MDPSEGDKSTRTNALKWFESHPLVATVLWALGADVRDNSEKQEEIKRRNSLNRSLSWRDDRDGRSIVEHSSRNQSPKFSDSNILHSTASSRTDRSSPSSATEDGEIVFKRSPPKLDERDSFEDSSPNNNYGFYVTISPPQEHLFPRVPRGDDT